MNYFPTYPVETEACKEHSAPLAQMVGTCFKAAGNAMPNFLAVNFYMVLAITCALKMLLNYILAKHSNWDEIDAEE